MRDLTAVAVVFDGGYAFEITDPAVGRILQSVNCGFTHDVVSVCKKDSQELTVEDRQALLEMLRRVDSTKVQSTWNRHGGVQRSVRVPPITPIVPLLLPY